jgi:long-chain acyl-CoA synthetase
MLLHDFLSAAVRRSPDKVVLVAGDARVSYRELENRVQRLAAGLQSRDVRRGDRIAIFLDNGIAVVVAWYAALRIGAVCTIVNPLTKTDKLRYLLNDALPSALITSVPLLREAVGAVQTAPSVRFVVVAADSVPAGVDGRYVTWACAEAGSAVSEPGTIDVDLASIIYTSGSTGRPKGVMLTHLNMVTATTTVSGYLGLRADDVIFCALPVAFDYGLYQVLMAVQVGATVVIERSFAFPVKALEAMARERATVFPGVPTMFSLMSGIRSLGQFDLTALRIISSTAAALPERRIQELRALFPQATLFSMYGLTECQRVSFLPPEQLDVRPASVGRGMPNSEVWLVDEHGKRLPNGSAGELVVRGSHVMRGYWGDPAATAERLKPGPYPGEFVLYSGDIFRSDGDGYLYFVARKDDMINSRGEKVSPREVENVIHALEGVREAAVVGVPDPVLGEAVKAYVVLRPGYACTDRDVIRHCLGHLENYMAPKFVEFVPDLPKTDTGKVFKKGLGGLPGGSAPEAV